MIDRTDPHPGALLAEENARLTDLLRAAAEKDRAAFEALYHATVNRLFGLAFRITQSKQMAEEVISDLYLQVWEQAAQYSSERGTVMAWLSIICRSRALDNLRRDQNQTRREKVLENTQSVSNDSMPTQELLSAVQEQSALHRALLDLDENSRQLLALAYFKDYSHSQLAEFTGIPIGTVKTRIRRAIETLKRTMVKTSESVGAFNE